MKVGSLFSGGGLGDLGFLMAGFEIAWQVEIDEYCQKILALRYPESKKYYDIKTLKGKDLEPVDIIAGGFPCQPFSVAGKQRGKGDNRYLWPEMLRIITEVRPRWVVGENVPGIINMALDDVCADLESEGYEVWPVVFPSHALGAWHKRDRLWIIAHRSNAGIESLRGREKSADEIMGHAGLLGQNEHEKQAAGVEQSGEDAPNSDSPRRREQRGSEPIQEKQFAVECDSENVPDASRMGRQPGADITREKCETIGGGIASIGSEALEAIWRKYWSREPQPAVGRLAHGVPNRVDRLKCLGNGQTPCSTYVIGKFIMEIENEKSQPS